MSPKIEMTPAKDSSVVTAYGYDPQSRTLRVQFNGGNTYDHPDVPLEKYAAFTGSDSMGKFYNRRIRPAHKAIKLKEGK